MYKRTAMFFKDLPTLFYPGDLSETADAINAALENGRVFRFEEAGLETLVDLNRTYLMSAFETRPPEAELVDEGEKERAA